MSAELSPRWGHVSAAVEDQVYVWGGHTKDFNKKKDVLASSVSFFDPVLESWADNQCSGPPPPGLYYGACASAGHHLYQYGGGDGPKWHGSLHQLDTKSWTWRQLSNAGPMKGHVSCGMVAYGSNLVIFGGCGIPSGPTQPGAEFIKNSRFTDGTGWTNEFHTFNLQEGEDLCVCAYES